MESQLERTKESGTVKNWMKARERHRVGLAVCIIWGPVGNHSVWRHKADLALVWISCSLSLQESRTFTEVTGLGWKLRNNNSLHIIHWQWHHWHIYISLHLSIHLCNHHFHYEHGRINMSFMLSHSLLRNREYTSKCFCSYLPPSWQLYWGINLF